MSDSIVHVVESNHHSSQLPTTDNAICVTSGDIDGDKNRQLQSSVAHLRFRLAHLQFLASARWFLLFMCLANFCRHASNALLGVTVSTLERRFALSSSQTAWIAAAYDIAEIPALIVGYFGSKLRRPLWIGGGMFVFAVSLFVYIIPHFAAPAYRYADSTDFGNLCVDDGQMSESWNSSITSRCSDDKVSDGSKYMAVFIVSMVVQGLGTLPLDVFGITCIHDASPLGTASVHIGILAYLLSQ